MAVAPESLAEQTPDASLPVASTSRRPLFLLATLGVVGTGAIMYSSFARPTPEKETPSASGVQQVLVPDHDSLAKLEAPLADAAMPALTDEPPLPPLEESVDPLAATSSPPPRAEGDPNRRLQKLQEEQMLKHLLEVQQQQLELRKKALVAPSAVREYAEAMRERAAENAELLRSIGGQRGDDSDGAFAEMMGPLQALSRARSAGGPGAASTGEYGEGTRDPNLTEDKRAFFATGGAQLQPGTLEHKVTKQRTPYELQMGDVIPGILISGINSESPGQILAQVSEDVCDSVTGNHLLIPQGSRLVGTYSAAVGQGQTRVQVAWVRLRMPNGDKLDLGGMSGADQLGVAGFRDRVNRHWAKRLAAALMASAFTVAYELTAPRNGTFYGSAVHRGVGENIVNLGADMAREEGRLPPTLEIRPGYRFNIMVQKDIEFAAPYVGAGRRARGC